jgi:hypothetical protein
MASEEAIDLDTAVSLEDVENLLTALLLHETSLDVKLEALLDPKNQPDLTSLSTIQSSLQIEDQISKLKDRIGPAAKVANSLSESVKKLDLEQARVTECLKYVEDVQELKVPSITY